jgi:Na+/melibiose symporter-like transporter
MTQNLAGRWKHALSELLRFAHIFVPGSPMMMHDDGDGNGENEEQAEHTAAATAFKQSSPTSAYRPRILYFSVFCWISVTGGRFQAPFLEHQVPHWTAAQIGLCLALQQVVGSLAGSWAGSTSDAVESEHPGRGRAASLLAGITAGTVLFLLHGVSHILGIVTVIADDNDHDNDNDHETVTNTHTHWSTSTAWHMSLRLLYALSTSFVFPVLDGMTLQYLEQTPGRDTAEYGQERLWGAISWAVTNFAIAPFLDLSGFTVFYPAAAAAAVLVVTTLYLYVVVESNAKSNSNNNQKRFRKRDSDLILPSENDNEGNDIIDDQTPGSNNSKEQQDLSPGTTVSSTRTDTLTTTVLLLKVIGTSYGAAFCLALLTLASGQAIVDGLVFLFFETLGSSYTVMGVTVVLTVFFEIPIFHVAPDLLKKYGAGPMLLLAGACYVVRVLGYSLIPNNHILYVLVLEPLHGVTYACSQTAAVAFVAQFMPVGYEASGQGLMYSMRGVGSVAGLWLGGWAFNTLGARIMYRASAVLVLVGISVFAGVRQYYAPPHLQQPHAILSQTDDDSDDLELTSTTASCRVGILDRDENNNDAFDDGIENNRLRRID